MANQPITDILTCKSGVETAFYQPPSVSCCFWDNLSPKYCERYPLIIVESKCCEWVKYTFSSAKIFPLKTDKAATVFAKSQLRGQMAPIQHRLLPTPRDVTHRPFIVPNIQLETRPFCWQKLHSIRERLHLGCRLTHTWRTCVYLQALAVNTKWLNKVADGVRVPKLHTWPQTLDWLRGRHGAKCQIVLQEKNSSFITGG